MMSRRVATAVDNGGSGQARSMERELRVVDSPDFHFVRALQCSAPVTREAVSFLDTQSTSHPFQFPEWAGKGAYLALLRQRGELRWFAQCGVFYPAGRVVPVRALSVNRGPVCDDLALLEAGLHRLVEESRKQGFAFIDVVPDWTGDFAGSAGTMLARNGWKALPGARSSLRLDLGRGPDQLLANFRKVTRYEIRRAERQEVHVRMARAENDRDQWLRLYRDMAAQKQFAAEDAGYVGRVLRWLGDEEDRGGLLLAHKDGSLLGGIVIVRSAARCWYVLGATVKDNRFSVGHLLQWRAIQWAKDRGCLEYDLSGGEYREGVDGGTAFFKRGFCDNVVHFLSPHRYVTSGTRLRVSDFMSKVRVGLRIS